MGVSWRLLFVDFLVLILDTWFLFKCRICSSRLKGVRIGLWELYIIFFHFWWKETEKHGKAPKKMISTSKPHAEHPFAEWNTKNSRNVLKVLIIYFWNDPKFPIPLPLLCLSCNMGMGKPQSWNRSCTGLVYYKLIIKNLIIIFTCVLRSNLQKNLIFF